MASERELLCEINGLPIVVREADGEVVLPQGREGVAAYFESRGTPEDLYDRSFTLDGHQCEMIADFSRFMEGERRWWFGRLTEPIEGFPSEAYCCHIKTAIKPEIVFGFNVHDLEYFPAMAVAVLGREIDPEWVERIAESAVRARADRQQEGDG